ncbi:MAG: tetratricopeptide repeat protein [Stenomitos rutilans HA7619-LM2]|jgi:tetratricopeptide (TPR) repeat protein|nr:tetratricopeptide repeat protein [Stenomitos rutilans HA7619-LM2]
MTYPSQSLPESLTVALQLHRSGRVAEAESVYRQRLEHQPHDVDALNLLGALVYQQHRFEEAIACFERVLTLQPENPDAYNSLGIALKGQGKLDEAVAHYQQALSRQPAHVEALNNLGNALKDLGDLEGAIAAYQQALDLRPTYPEAHNNLGTALKDQGMLEEAIAHYQEALRLKPNYAEAHHNLGVVLQHQGTLDGAIHNYQQAIALKPHYSEAHFHWGSTLQQQGNLEAAIAQYRQAIALKPTYAEAHHGLANVLQLQGKLDEAIVVYHDVLVLRKNYAEAHNNLGNALQELGRREEAIAHYERALVLRSSFAEAHSNLGSVLKDLKQFEQAIAHFQQALAIRPDYAEVHNNLGNAYQDQGNLEAAIDCYRKAVAINPNFAEIRSNLGNLLQQNGEFAEAFEQFEAAIAVQPDYTGAYNNLGIARRNHGDIEAAFAAYNQALTLDPDFVEAKWNKALTQLFTGDLAQGFAGYEWRFQWSKFQEQNPPRSFPQPCWDGSPLNGKAILLYTEQGLGDTIQFIRYAAIVVQWGGNVLVECQTALVNLLQNVAGIQQIIPYGNPLPAFDVHAPLMSLPHLLGTTLDTIPAAIPYLQAPASPAPPLPPSPLPTPHSPLPFKVGLIWSGNPHNPYNRSRACPLALLLSLAALPNITLYSLQKELSAAEQQQLADCPHIHNLQEHLHDFVDTAGLIHQLDLVIAVDTAVAHLAGALGKPVWLLLPFAPDWRWMQARNDSPWYSTMRLFRQPAYGDWGSVIQAVEKALIGRTTDNRRDAEARRQSTESFGEAGYGGQKAEGKRQKAGGNQNALYTSHLTSHTSLPTQHSELKTQDLKLKTHPLHSLLKKAVRHHQAGNYREAEQVCRQILQQQEDHSDAWHLLGMVAHQERRFEEAIAAYRQVLVTAPDNYDTYNNLAVALQELGQIDEAIAHYEKAIALKPDYADAHNNFANALRHKELTEEAIVHYQQAIAFRPHYADAHNNLGLIYFAEGAFELAATCYRQAITVKPDFPQAHNHLGNALKELGDFDTAIAHYERAIALKPDYAKAFNNWGNIFRDRGALQEAVQYYNQATTIEPAFAEAHWNKALTLLLNGELQAGFAEYEWRWQVKLPTFQPMRPLSQPCWDGSPLAGKTIFLHAEQGMGDMIQFVRYVPLVAQRGGRIVLECHGPLVNLFKQLPSVHAIVSYGSTPPPFDVHAPLMSLPHILGTTLDTIPANIPYLQLPASPALPLPLPPPSPHPTPHTPHPTPHTPHPFKIGLVWSGNPQNPYNRTRACPLDHLLALAEIPGITLYSLQKDLSESDRDLLQAHPHLEDLREHLHDFVDTAVLIHQLDLVIAVDTSVAHLAGALGKPIWLLLPFAPDWRWMLGREDSPWYSTMHLFRQPAYGDWGSVIQSVKKALTDKVGGNRRGVEAQRQTINSQQSTINSQKQTNSKLRTQNSKLSPHTPHPTPHILSLALHHYHDGNFAEAERLCRQVLQQEPDRLEALQILSVSLCCMGQAIAAIPYLQQVVHLQPDAAEAWSNLGTALREQGRTEKAIAHFNRAIVLQPTYADAHYNLALVLQEHDRLEDALFHSQQVLALKPDFADAYYNHGFLLRRLGRLEEAIAHYRNAIQLAPDSAGAHKNLGHALLLTGDLPQGFQEYEWRWRQPGWAARSYSQPLWNGSPLDGKTILLHAEQGLGDTIQFIRYAPLVKQLGARVIVECQSELLTLLESATDIDQLLAQGAPVPAFDVHAPLLSLPHLLGTTLETIPAHIPYLQPPQTLLSPLPSPLSPLPSLKVGIVWTGNPDHKNNRYRSFAINQFLAVCQLPEVSFYSLQKGADADLQTLSTVSIQDVGQHLHDFNDTAAAIAQLDLVITMDTAVAHLAGALGKPVWLLLSFAPDWRWLLEREDSPWYPTMRLFRQRQRGHWQGVFEQVAAALWQWTETGKRNRHRK